MRKVGAATALQHEKGNEGRNVRACVYVPLR